MFQEMYSKQRGDKIVLIPFLPLHTVQWCTPPVQLHILKINVQVPTKDCVPGLQGGYSHPPGQAACNYTGKLLPEGF